MIHAHATIEGYYKEISTILHSDMVPLTLSEIENLPPGELDIYVIMLAQKAREDAESKR